MLLQNVVLKILLASCLMLSYGYSITLYSKEPARVIAGWVENVRVENQDFEVKAKLDTGAKTSSIHAKNIESYKKDGERWVKFTLVLKDKKGGLHEIVLDRPRSRRTKIKNHDGEHDRRHVVDLAICFNGRTITTEFTMADRTEYIYDVLLGREFLKNAAIIDPKKVFLTVAQCN